MTYLARLIHLWPALALAVVAERTRRIEDDYRAVFGPEFRL